MSQNFTVDTVFTMAIQQRASGIFARAQSLIDHVVSPDTRGKFYSNVNAFAHEQPLLFVRPLYPSQDSPASPSPMRSLLTPKTTQFSS